MGVLCKIAAHGQDMSPGQQALYAAANLAKPPGAPPLPKPIDGADPAGDALAAQDAEIEQQKLELEKQKQEAAHRKEIDNKDKEIASLRQDVQKANMEAQRIRNEMELMKHHQADMDKLRSESEKLNSRRDQMAGEEAQHKSRLAEAVADAKADIAEEKAKAKEDTANSNAQAYIKMTEDARKHSDEMFAGARDEVMKQREDVIKQKESILNDKAKAFDERMNAANERSKMSPYLMKSLQDAAAAARNIAKLRDRSLNGMDNVFLSDMGKQANTVTTNSGRFDPYSITSTVGGTEGTSSRIEGENSYVTGKLRAMNDRNKDAVRAQYSHLLDDQTAGGHAMTGARFGSLSDQLRTQGVEAQYDEDGELIPTGRLEKEKGIKPEGNLFDASIAKEIAEDENAAARKRLKAISGAKAGSDEAIERARYEMLHHEDKGLWSNRKSKIDQARNGFADANREWESDQSNPFTMDLSWYNPLKYVRFATKIPYYAAKYLVYEPLNMVNESVQDANRTYAMADAYGHQLNHFSGNHYSSDAAKQAFEEDAKKDGVASSAWGATARVGGSAGLATVDLLTTIAMLTGVGTAAGAAGKAAIHGLRYGGKAVAKQATKDAWNLSREAWKGAKANGYAGYNGFLRGANKLNDAMFGNWKRMAVSIPATVGANIAMPRYNAQSQQQLAHGGSQYSGGYSQPGYEYNPDAYSQANRQFGGGAAAPFAQGSSSFGHSGAGMGKVASTVKSAANAVAVPSGSTPASVSSGNTNQARPVSRGSDRTANWINTGYNHMNTGNVWASSNTSGAMYKALRTAAQLGSGLLGLDLGAMGPEQPDMSDTYRRMALNNITRDMHSSIRPENSARVYRKDGGAASSDAQAAVLRENEAAYEDWLSQFSAVPSRSVFPRGLSGAYV